MSSKTPKVIKMFMLNLAVHAITNARNVKKDIKGFKEFDIFSDKPNMLFFLLIDVEMLITVGILTFMSSKNFILS